MKQTIQISAIIIFTVLVVFPLAAMSEVMISLKNGREIIADSCRETKDMLVCEKMGGTFEIGKKDILNSRGITIKHEKMYESPVQEPVPLVEGQKGADKSTAGIKDTAVDTKDPAKPGEGVIIRGANPEQEKRLDEINQRKLELRQERDKLGKDREQLQQDAKDMGVIYTQEQFDGINKRITDVEERISRFNEEVKKLNAEEAGIIEGLNKGK